MEGSHDAYLLLRSVIAQLKLADPKNREETKQLLESTQNDLEGHAGIDTSVYANFYKAYATYHKVRPAIAGVSLSWVYPVVLIMYSLVLCIIGAARWPLS